MFSYPKLKYQPVISPEQEGHWRYVKVADPAEEELLGPGWYDAPSEFPKEEEPAHTPEAEVKPARRQRKAKSE